MAIDLIDAQIVGPNVQEGVNKLASPFLAGSERRGVDRCGRRPCNGCRVPDDARQHRGARAARPIRR